jgi:hypothetical protein
MTWLLVAWNVVCREVGSPIAPHCRAKGRNALVSLRSTQDEGGHSDCPGGENVLFTKVRSGLSLLVSKPTRQFVKFAVRNTIGYCEAKERHPRTPAMEVDGEQSENEARVILTSVSETTERK